MHVDCRRHDGDPPVIVTRLTSAQPQILLLNIRQDLVSPTRGLFRTDVGCPGVKTWWCRPVPAAGRENLMHIQVIVKRQPDLLQVVTAPGTTSGFARLLHCRQQQSNQNGNDCDHNQ